MGAELTLDEFKQTLKGTGAGQFGTWGKMTNCYEAVLPHQVGYLTWAPNEGWVVTVRTNVGRIEDVLACARKTVKVLEQLADALPKVEPEGTK